MYPTPFLPKIWGLKQIKLFCRESLKINPIPSFPLIQLHLRNRGFASIWQSAKKILIIWIGCLWYLFTEWSSLAHLSRSFFCSKSSLTSSARQTLKVQGRYHANQPTKGRAKGLVARISSLPIQSQCSTSAPSPPAHPPQFAVATPQPNCRAAELLLPFYTSVAPPSFPFYQTAPAMSDLWEKHFQCNVVPILSAMATSKLHK